MSRTPGGERANAYSAAMLALGIFVAAASVVLMGVQPILVSFFSDHLSLNLNQNGWVLAAEQYGAAAGALFGYVIAGRMAWNRAIVGGCALAAIANLASPYVDGVGELIATRFLSGFFTTGVYTVGVFFLSHAINPDRVFGFLMVLTTSFFSVDAMLLPVLIDQYGYAIAVGSGAIWFLAAMLAGAWLPAGPGAGSDARDAPPANRSARPIVGMTALLGGFLLQLSIFSVWGFLDSVGRNDGLTGEQIGYGIGIGVLGGIPAALVPAIVGDRYGRISMIAVSTVLLAASYFALERQLTFPAYVFWIAVMNIGWVLGLVYYMGLTVAHDPNGRFARLMTFTQFLAAGVGPTCSALVISNNKLSPIFLVAAVSATAGLVAVALANWAQAPARLMTSMAKPDDPA
jgi:MFS family permease